MRVQIPAYTSSWMRGDRYGEIVKTGWLNKMGPDKRARIEIARVKLDKSGRTILVDLNDCTVVS
jgi:hypothetical protein